MVNVLVLPKPHRGQVDWHQSPKKTGKLLRRKEGIKTMQMRLGMRHCSSLHRSLLTIH